MAKKKNEKITGNPQFETKFDNQEVDRNSNTNDPATNKTLKKRK